MNIWKKKEKKPYPRSFARRLTWRIMLMQFVVMGIISVIIMIIGWAIAYGAIVAICNRQMEYKAKSVEQTLTEIHVAAVNMVPDIESSLRHPDHLQDIVKRIVALNPNIQSCGIGFREGYYPQKGRWYWPFAQRSQGDSTIVAQNIGGQEQDYLHEAWFQEAMTAKEGYWSKPFFGGEDKATPLVAYLMPIRDERDSTVAVLNVNMSQKLLQQHALSIQVSRKDNDEKWTAEQNLYFFIIDSLGTILAHPDKGRVIRQNFLDMVRQTADTTDDYALEKALRDDDSGNVDQDNHGNDIFVEGEKVVVCYNHIDHTPWTILMAFPMIYINVVGYIVGGVLLFFILIGLLVVFFAGRRGIKKTSEPLRQLAASANEVAKGNFDAHLPDIKSRDEIHLLRDTFENMQHSLTRYVSELRDTTAQKASIESELKIAHDIQMAMLPKTFPPYPERDDVDIFGSLKPAKAVGGDLFDFYIRDNQLFFCIGDVSGKGVPASLVMAVARFLFRNISAHVASPGQIAYTLNNALAEGNETNMFVTLFVGVLDLTTGHLSYCNAGHNSPLILGREVSELPCVSNLPIGIMADFQFEAQETSLAPHDTIFLFTDGLTEAENVRHAQFGDERTHQVATQMLSCRQKQPQRLIERMQNEVHLFVCGAEQSDDLTMLAVQYKPTNGA